MSIELVETIKLEPEDGARLKSLCGTFDENLKVLENSFNVDISRFNFEFNIKPNSENKSPYRHKILKAVAEILKQLYVDTAPIQGKIKELEPSDVHLQIQESKELIQNLTSPSVDPYKHVIKTKKGIIKPRTDNQIKYLHNILTHDISFGIGPAGTGKTYLAVAAAVESLERQEVRRIVLTRPAVEAGEKLGFLPGDLGQKVDPYLRPLYDALYEMLGFEKVEKYMERAIIEIAPLAYMRGRTLNDAFIILDESQNTTTEQMKMFLTRIGFNSKAIITGDVTQIDLPKNQKSGLKHAIDTLSEIEELSFNYFVSQDIVRHPIVAKIVEAYEVMEQKERVEREQRKYDREQRNQLELQKNKLEQEQEILERIYQQQIIKK